MGGSQSRHGNQVCEMEVDRTHLQIDGFLREQERLQLEQQRLQRELKTERDRNAQLAQENRRLQEALAAAQQQCKGIQAEYMRYVDEHERAAPGGKMAVGYALASKQKSSAKFEVRNCYSHLMPPCHVLIWSARRRYVSWWRSRQGARIPRPSWPPGSPQWRAPHPPSSSTCSFPGESKDRGHMVQATITAFDLCFVMSASTGRLVDDMTNYADQEVLQAARAAGEPVLIHAPAEGEGLAQLP
jgi:hypothetical protein